MWQDATHNFCWVLSGTRFIPAHTWDDCVLLPDKEGES